MKNLLIFILMLGVTFAYSQEIAPTFEKVGKLVKATYYHEDGKIKEQGFFKDKKLTGTWIRFDKNGKKTQIANFKNGKKVGKWFLWFGDTLKEIDYVNNVVISVNTWKESSQLAINN